MSEDISKPRPSYYDLKISITAVVTLNFDLDLSKVSYSLTFVMLNICTKFRETRTCTITEITTSVANQRKNQPTNKHM